VVTICSILPVLPPIEPSRWFAGGDVPAFASPKVPSDNTELQSKGGFELNDHRPSGRVMTPVSEKGLQATMKRAIFALSAVALVAATSGCCCFERLFCCGCGGCCAYGHEGPCDSCGGGGCSECGMAGGSVTGPSAAYANSQHYHPAGGHPLVHQRRDAGGEYEFAAGPPTGGVTYPYYTNRGPRDYLARNPRGIGP